MNGLFNYSVGIHPWFINNVKLKEEMVAMKIASHKENVLAIGECGLDRLCETDFKLQEKVFTEQIIWANEIAKPLIIHSVRAHREVLHLLKEYNVTSPFIFHGFNNSYEQAKQILDAGGYLSFGKALLNPGMEETFSKIPLGSIFLETDDSDISIETVYRQASKIKNITAERLHLQIQENVIKVFKKEI